MRFTIVVALLFSPATLLAQSSPCMPSPSSLVQFDPYNPSDLAIIRNYGGTVLAQAPLSSLLQLDPYVPTQAALLRQLGGAIPFWAYPVFPQYSPAPAGVPCGPDRRMAAAAVRAPTTFSPSLTSFNDVLAVLPQRAPRAARTVRETSSARVRGITIEHDGRQWASAGRAVPFTEAAFERIGDAAGSPIFRRAGGKDAVIYVRTTSGMLAPFRAVP